MKKYRLKEGIRKLFKSNSPMLGDIMTVKDWQIKYGIFSCDLEEVQERIELEITEIQEGIKIEYKPLHLTKKNRAYFTEQEKELCEKALNGELLDIDSLDNGEFRNFETRSLDYIHIYNSDLIAYLKQYLKEKK